LVFVSMDYAIIRELKHLSSLERGAIDKHPAECAVALVYPNSYYVGMSSLGFQLVYGLFNSLPGVRCERGFFIPGGQTYTVESLKPLRDFDCIAFSLSSEQDYFNVIEILRRAGMPLDARERDERYPLVIGGGVCAWLNPEPIADVFDLFVLGEAEAVSARLFQRIVAGGGGGREELLRALAGIPGVYVPRMYEPHYGDDGRFLAVEARAPGLPLLERQWVGKLEGLPALAPIVTPKTDFGEKTIVEMMRGCGRQCRFCVAGYAYRPPRFRKVDAIMEAASRALSSGGGIALLGPSLTDHPDLEEVCSEIVKRGGRISMSSVRPGRIGDRLLGILVRGGLKSLTVAPETPAERLQRRLNKEIHAPDLLRFAECARAAGLKELKLYYLFGIEGETAADRQAIVEEVRNVASKIAVRVSVGPLVPKARTPLQWAAMEGEGDLRNGYYMLRKSIARIPRARISGQSIRGAIVEAALSRGDRALTPHLVAGKLPRAVIERYALRRRGEHEPFPWEHIGVGVKREYLWAEYQKYRRGGLTSPCIPGECISCGVCR
jgi:radical SAM superfamily enzyme YgiQ (UPF0313 family)